MSSSSEDLLPLEEFLIDDNDVIGEGAESKVYKGIFRNKVVAIKKHERCHISLEKLIFLVHPNLVTTFGKLMWNTHPYMVMEYCSGGSLYDYLQNRLTLTPSLFMNFAKQIASGMSYLHEQGLVHRDLKSPNILLTENQRVKICDFGTIINVPKTTGLSFKGTVRWMAPELLRNEPCKHQVDIWSYGVVLWEMLTGEIPYKNLCVEAVGFNVMKGTISLPLFTTIPDELKDLFKHCLLPDWRQRWEFSCIVEYLDKINGTLDSIKEDEWEMLRQKWLAELQYTYSFQFINEFYNLYDKNEEESQKAFIAEAMDFLKTLSNATKNLIDQQIKKYLTMDRETNRLIYTRPYFNYVKNLFSFQLTNNADSLSKNLCFISTDEYYNETKAKELGVYLNRKVVFLNCNELKCVEDVKGYETPPKIGKLMESVIESDAKNPLIVFTNFQLLLERNDQALTDLIITLICGNMSSSFHDNYLGFNYDISDLTYAFTCTSDQNDIDFIPTPIKDRLRIVNFNKSLPDFNITELRKFISFTNFSDEETEFALNCVETAFREHKNELNTYIQTEFHEKYDLHWESVSTSRRLLEKELENIYRGDLKSIVFDLPHMVLRISTEPKKLSTLTSEEWNKAISEACIGPSVLDHIIELFVKIYEEKKTIQGISKHVEEQLNSNFEGCWNCLIGRFYGMSCKSEQYVNFHLNEYDILIFITANQGSKILEEFHIEDLYSAVVETNMLDLEKEELLTMLVDFQTEHTHFHSLIKAVAEAFSQRHDYFWNGFLGRCCSIDTKQHDFIYIKFQNHEITFMKVINDQPRVFFTYDKEDLVKGISKNSTLPSEMQDFGIDVIYTALQSCDTFKKATSEIKTKFDLKYGPLWQCIVCRSNVTIIDLEMELLIVNVGDIYVFIWRTYLKGFKISGAYTPEELNSSITKCTFSKSTKEETLSILSEALQNDLLFQEASTNFSKKFEQQHGPGICCLIGRYYSGYIAVEEMLEIKISGLHIMIYLYHTKEFSLREGLTEAEISKYILDYNMPSEMKQSAINCIMEASTGCLRIT